MDGLLEICRICLASNVQMFKLIKTNLQEMYEKLTDISFSNEDGRPLYACYMCHAYLKKCYNFRMKSLRANETLTQLLLSEMGLTYESLRFIDRSMYNLVDNLAISPLEHYIIKPCTNEENNIIIVKQENVPIKFERAVVKEEELNKSDEITRRNEQMDYGFDGDYQQYSDPEDDIPLKNIVLRKKRARRAKKHASAHLTTVQKKKGDYGFSNHHLIILSREQQLLEMKGRLSSLNYLNSPYKCDLCYRGFVDIRAYNNHKDKHDERSGSHECTVCHMRYPTARHVRVHMESSHVRQYACNECGRVSHTANQAREHEKWHRGHTYECQLCAKKFLKSTSYLTHMRTSHPTEHMCEICGESFISKHGVIMHKQKVHKRDEIISEDPEEPASSRYCGECNVQFLTVEAWKRHILTSVKHAVQNENSAQCRICGVECSSSEARAHLRSHTRNLRGKLPNNVPSEKPESKLACDQCGSRFVCRYKLQAHIKRMHLGLKYNKNIVCEVCGKKCSSNASLKYHQRTHTGERPYSCDICHKRFADKNQVRIHVRTHTGEKPYACSACPKRFTQKPALNRHYRIHTGAKPYECQLCPKMFTQSNSLKLHVKAVHLRIPSNRRSKNLSKKDTQEKEIQENVELPTV